MCTKASFLSICISLFDWYRPRIWMDTSPLKISLLSGYRVMQVSQRPLSHKYPSWYVSCPNQLQSSHDMTRPMSVYLRTGRKPSNHCIILPTHAHIHPHTHPSTHPHPLSLTHTHPLTQTHTHVSFQLTHPFSYLHLPITCKAALT